MELHLLKRIHQGGQSVYGVYESKGEALEQINKLKILNPYVSKSEYIAIPLLLNELVEIDPEDEE